MHNKQCSSPWVARNVLLYICADLCHNYICSFGVAHPIEMVVVNAASVSANCGGSATIAAIRCVFMFRAPLCLQMMVGPVLCGSHPLTWGMWGVIATVSVATSHSGYSVLGAAAHDEHHLKFKCGPTPRLFLFKITAAQSTNR
eukprot:SAG31_NODE_2139_length_6349_cov_2.773636_2_plen_143_part_00